MSPNITVVGSFAVGLTLRADRFPVGGETLIGRDFDQGPGGKGSNQAVQIARLGGKVEFVAAIGTDSLGEVGTRLYAQEGVGTTYLTRTSAMNTGVGFIVLNQAGENFIVLDPGANALLTPDLVDRALPAIRASRAVVTQLEIPVATAIHSMRRAREAGALALLNPAPAARLTAEQIGQVDLLTPNRTELRILLGRSPDDPTPDLDLAGQILSLGARAVVLTRGAEGALIITPEGTRAIPAVPVPVTDTTGAGDAFTGALVTALAGGADLEAATRQAVVAGGLACTKLGVIPALATRAELDAFIETQRTHIAEQRSTTQP